jgi:molybdopterin/thiamine biosynthesis adenylyltransferase
MRNLTQEDFLRYKRQMVLPDFGSTAQEKLKNAKVLVVGAGGLGCPVLQYLAAAGVGCIGIVEFDLIGFTNLQRQVLFASNEVGSSKLDVTKQKIQAQNPSLEIIPFNTKLAKDNALDIINDFQLVIDCSDNFATKYLINDACCILNKPFIYASILRYEGQLAVFNFSQNNLPKVTYRCLFPEPSQNDLAPSCADSGVWAV